MVSVKVKKLVQVFISVILLTLLVRYVDITRVVHSLSLINLNLLFLAILMALLNRFLMPFKWMILLRAKSVDVKYYELLKIYFISTFLGFFLPPTLGQDSIRTYYLSKKNCSIENAISSIVIERYLGLLVTVIFGLIGYMLILNNYEKFDSIMGGLLTFTVIFFSAILLLFIVSFSSYFYNKVMHVLSNGMRIKILNKIAGLITKIYKSYFSFRKNKYTLLVFFLLTTVEISITILRSYVISVSLGLDLPAVFFFSFVPIILFLIRLPLSFDGFGIHEGGFVYFMEMVGADPAVAFSVGSLNHIIFILLILPGWYFYVVNKSSLQLDGKMKSSQ